MSDALPAPEAAVEAPFVSDYVPGTVGHAVLAVGHDHSGAEAMAVWQVSPTGQPTGAWILATGADGGEADREKAQRLFKMVERRSVVGWSSEDVSDLLGRLAEAAGVELAPGWDETAVYLPAALAEIAGYRRRHAE